MMDDAITHRAAVDDEADETGLSDAELQPSLLHERVMEEHPRAK
jgi:hypothetical protein